jgi:hypothetical protein
VVELAAGVLKASPNVFGLKVRQLLQHLLGGQAVPQQVQNVNDADAHAPDAGAAAALLWIDRDAIHTCIVHLPSRFCTFNFSRAAMCLTAGIYTDASQLTCTETLSFLAKLSPEEMGSGKIS